MRGEDFLRSEWIEKAKQPATEEKIKSSFEKWAQHVKNTGLLHRAKQLWDFFLSGKSTEMEKVVVAAALLYCITPLDLMPDFIPVIGWLDDLGIASFALAYIFKKMDEVERAEFLSKNIEGIDEKVISSLDNYVADFGTAEKSKTLSYEIKEIKNIANELGADELASSIDDLENLFEKRLFNVVVVGRYSTGKSTLINALLGEDRLSYGPTPTTKAVTHIFHAKEPFLYSQAKDGTIRFINP